MNTTLAPSADRSNSPQSAGSGAFLANNRLAVTPDQSTSTPGTFYGATAYNSSASAGFLLFIDQSAALAGAEVPALPAIPIAAASFVAIDFGTYGFGVTRGLKAAFSSTAATYTAVATTEVAIEVRFMSSPGQK